MDNLTFDPEKFRLGKLCPKGHQWGNTGKSLRYIKCSACVACNNSRKTYDPEYHKVWYEKNRDRLRDVRKQYRQKNQERELERHRIYREQNRDAIRESGKDYYRRNRTKIIARTQKYQHDNRDACRQRGIIYRLSHADTIKELRRRYLASPQGKESLKRSKVRRKARKASCHVYPYEKSLVLVRFENRCAYCGINGKLDIDHFIPMSKGGSDCLGNVVPACDRCNSSKWNHDPLDWYSRQPFYSKSRWLYILKVLGKTEATYSQLPLF